VEQRVCANADKRERAKTTSAEKHEVNHGVSTPLQNFPSNERGGAYRAGPIRPLRSALCPQRGVIRREGLGDANSRRGARGRGDRRPMRVVHQAGLSHCDNSRCSAPRRTMPCRSCRPRSSHEGAATARRSTNRTRRPLRRARPARFRSAGRKHGSRLTLADRLVMRMTCPDVHVVQRFFCAQDRGRGPNSNPRESTSRSACNRGVKLEGVYDVNDLYRRSPFCGVQRQCPKRQAGYVGRTAHRKAAARFCDPDPKGKFLMRRRKNRRRFRHTRSIQATGALRDFIAKKLSGGKGGQTGRNRFPSIDLRSRPDYCLNAVVERS